MSNLLYYPYINLPRTDWTLRTLLYYDNIGSIVPQEYFYHPSNYDGFTLDLIKNGLITPIDPIRCLDNPWRLSEPFLQHIKNNKSTIEKARTRFSKSISGKADDLTLIHADKFHENVFYGLMELGVAKRKDYGLYEVDKKIAHDLMMFLASLVGASTNRIPTTDYIKPKYSRQTFAKEQTKREKILSELIPFPEDIDLRKLEKFKSKHIDLLRRFRTQIELIVTDPNILEGSAQYHYRIAELVEAKEDLTAKMNESRFNKILFGSIAGATGAIIGLPIDGGTGALLGSLPGFISTVHSALQIEKPENVQNINGMKYLALVDRRVSVRKSIEL